MGVEEEDAVGELDAVEAVQEGRAESVGRRVYSDANTRFPLAMLVVIYALAAAFLTAGFSERTWGESHQSGFDQKMGLWKLRTKVKRPNNDGHKVDNRDLDCEHLGTVECDLLKSCQAFAVITFVFAVLVVGGVLCSNYLARSQHWLADHVPERAKSHKTLSLVCVLCAVLATVVPPVWSIFLDDLNSDNDFYATNLQIGAAYELWIVSTALFYILSCVAFFYEEPPRRPVSVRALGNSSSGAEGSGRELITSHLVSATSDNGNSGPGTPPASFSISSHTTGADSDSGDVVGRGRDDSDARPPSLVSRPQHTRATTSMAPGARGNTSLFGGPGSVIGPQHYSTGAGPGYQGHDPITIDNPAVAAAADAAPPPTSGGVNV